MICACITACSTAQLEARLEANPQCKDVVNPKTGSVMPCPGSDKAFYKSVGLDSSKANSVVKNDLVVQSSPAISPTNINVDSASKKVTQPATSDCKPVLHKKLVAYYRAPPPTNWYLKDCINNGFYVSGF
jgi:hypothetical protein